MATPDMNLHLFNPLRWKRSFLATVLAVIVLLWFAFFDTYSVWTRVQLNMEKSELEQRTEQLRQEIEELEQKILDLQENPDLLERIAREEYGMRREGETVYIITEEP
ncbi:MAG: septum formation initiator family protein [Balneolaceae bacterium]